MPFSASSTKESNTSWHFLEKKKQGSVTLTKTGTFYFPNTFNETQTLAFIISELWPLFFLLVLLKAQQIRKIMLHCQYTFGQLSSLACGFMCLFCKFGKQLCPSVCFAEFSDIQISHHRLISLANKLSDPTRSKLQQPKSQLPSCITHTSGHTAHQFCEEGEAGPARWERVFPSNWCTNSWRPPHVRSVRREKLDLL